MSMTRKLNRTGSHRKAMMRNMVTQLIDNNRIETTLPKAKELRRWAEKMVTLAKAGDLASRQRALGFVRRKDTVRYLFGTFGQRYADRQGGYTRIIRLGQRKSDSATRCLIEFVGEPLPWVDPSKKQDVWRVIPPMNGKPGQLMEPIRGSTITASIRAEKDASKLGGVGAGTTVKREQGLHDDEMEDDVVDAQIVGR